MAKTDDFESQIIRRLDVLIALQLGAAGEPMAARIERLAEIGLAPAQIGKILGRESNYVSAALKNSKKKKGGR